MSNLYRNELFHHGVKGQKWGERKYQYEDGSLTPEGRTHYGYGNGNTKLHSRLKNVQNKTVKVTKQELKLNGSGGGSGEDEEANKLGDELIKKIEEFASKQKDNPNFNSDVSSWLDPKAAKGSEGSIEWYLEEYLNIDSAKLNNSTIKKIETKFKNHFKSNLTHSLKIQGNELYHWGIKGQKWGDRRYQNEDGTYTEEGKIRRRKGSDDYIRSRELMRKGVNNLSNKELQDLNSRQSLERQYSQNNASIGKRFVEQYKNALLSSIVGAAVAATMVKGKTTIAKLKG